MIASDEAREAIRERVLELSEWRWKRIHPTSLLGKLISPLFVTPKLEAIFIVEQDTGDLDSLLCGGNAVNAWRHDSGGRRKIDLNDVDTGPVHGVIWYRRLTQFFIATEHDSVVVNEWEGPGRGRLCRYSVKTNGADIRLKLLWATTAIDAQSLG
jgi:hypothetical protein